MTVNNSTIAPQDWPIKTLRCDVTYPVLYIQSSKCSSCVYSHARARFTPSFPLLLSSPQAHPRDLYLFTTNTW